MIRLLVTVFFSFLIVGCGSSSKQRLGESFSLHGLAKLEKKKGQSDNGQGDNNENDPPEFQCSFSIVNDIFVSGPSSLCIVVENLMTSQRIILRDYEVELRIPGALVQPPSFRVTLSGLLEKKPKEQQNQGAQSQQTSAEFDYFLTQENSDTGNKASLPITFPPLEFFNWYLANLGAMPQLRDIPTEAIITAHGQTSPGGDWVRTNKIYVRVTIPGPR